ncbi:hypothetical protein ATEIFO6365_0004033700 [Aspergillus terreus]|uniref:N-acetylgalactosaminide beta-1,3-galactosyltransferase n=1 Tax=Aspergillus terreus TaxID=33178 RepID=A0A5M3YR54_ASPTE|nr:hypothetical protein ATETN484_0002036200 [Aspergillus terreus]GFF15218.1 hypothetical protein ATEIFO6365_0004033700 [Aspergillus terreus]
MLKAFYKDNRMVPLGLMLLTIIIFIYHFELDRQGPTLPLVPDALVAEPQKDAGSTTRTTTTIKEPEKEAVEKPVHSAVPSKTPSAPSTHHISHAQQQQTPSITGDDIVLVFKSGASAFWKRVPIHLATTLSPARISPDNVLLYSDQAETVGPWEFIDVLANSSEKVRQSQDFVPYLQQQDFDDRQNYAELSNVPGDSPGLSGGWKLDRLKWLPMIKHAGEAKPNAKWYIFNEDDSFVFLRNLERHLEKFNHEEPWYLGSLAWNNGIYFAHGGSGFALSRGAWMKSFGQDPDILEKFESYTVQHSFGDHILGHVLHEYGVEFGETHGDSRFTYGFNPEAHWSTWYEPANWCKPVYSWHHTHGRDVARFYNLEQSWDFEKRGPIRYRDIFNEFVAPYLRERVEWWDNWSSKHDIRSNTAEKAEVPDTVKSADTWRSAWKSVDACEAACKSWAQCVQWSYYEDRCKMDSMMLLGSGIPPGDSRRETSLPWTSGWLKRRVENWECQE